MDSGRRRLGALLRRHLRVGRRQRLLRPLLGSQPGLHLGHLRARRGPGRQLRPHRLPRLRLHGDARATRTTASTTTRTASPTRAATAAPGTRIDGQAGHPGLRLRALRHGQVPGLLRSAREAPGLPRRALVDRATRTWTGRAEFHDVGADGVAGTRRHGRGRRHPDRGRALLRPHRQGRVGPDRPDRLQDEPHQGRRRQPEPDRRRHPLLRARATHWPTRLWRALHRPQSRPPGSTPRWRRTTTSASCSPRARSSCRPGKRERFSLALAYGAGPDRAARDGAHGPADLQRELPVRGAAAAADRDGRGRRRLRAAVVGRRRGARRRPGDRTSSTSRATASTARPIPSSATRRSWPRARNQPLARQREAHPPSSTSRTARPATRARSSSGIGYYLGNDSGHHAHLDRHHGDERPAVLLRGVRLRLRLRSRLRLARDLPVGELDHGLAHAARAA